MTAENARDSFLFDTRMITRNIRNGTYKQAEVEKHLDALPDLAEQYVEIDPKIFGESASNLAVSGEFHSGDADE